MQKIIGVNTAIRNNPITGDLEFSNDNGATWKAIGSGSGGTGVGDALYKSEIGMPVEDAQDRILDTFNSNQGTKVNCAAMSSALIPTANTWSYLNTALGSCELGKVDGQVVADIQHLKPKEKFTSNVIKFDGDVTNMFTDTKKVIVTLVKSDNNNIAVQCLRNSQNNPAMNITVSGAPSYSSVNDETTLTLANPDALDLNIGLTTDGDAQSYLRVIPFDWTFKVGSDVEGNIAEIELDKISAYNGGQIGLVGEGYFSESGGITGTCFKSDIVFSENKQYGIRWFEENRSTVDYHVFEYSVDKGKTWNYFGASGKTTSELSSGYTGLANEDNGNFFQINRSQIAVANNGKFFIVPNYYGGTYWQVHGRYGDLQATTPSLNLTIDLGLGYGAGVLYKNAADHMYGQVSADPINGSYIAVRGVNSTSSNFIRTFNDNGDTYLGIASSGASVMGHDYSEVSILTISGSGTTHTTILVGTHVSNHDMYSFYVTEANPTGGVSQGIIYTGTALLIDAKINSTYLILLFQESSTSIRFMYQTLSSYIWSGDKILSNFGGVDTYQGWSTTGASNYYKGYHQKIVCDPSDDKHVFFVQNDNNIVTHPIIYEVKDIINYEGETINQTSTNSGYDLRGSSSDEMIGQTFQAPASGKLETASFYVYQQGKIPSGYKMWAEIWNTTTGLPTSIIHATNGKSQEIDPSLISTNPYHATNNVWIRFNFPRALSLTPSSTYAVVLRADYPISSNRISIHGYNSSVYGGGTRVLYNGSSWSSTSTDFVFKIASHKMTDIGNALTNDVAPIYDYRHNWEESIELLDNTNIQFICRRGFNVGTPNAYPISGHPYRKIIPFTAGGSVECDTSGELKPVTLNNVFDENLVFNVSLGSEANAARYDLVTGALTSPSYPFSQRVGIPINNVMGTISTGTADSDFESGYCADFASGQYIQYGQSTLNTSVWDLSDRDFCMEVELKKGSAFSADHDFFTSWVSNGFIFRVNSSSKLNFIIDSGANNTTSVGSVPLTYCKLRATRKNGIVKLWKSDPLVSSGAWIEFSYSANNADNKTITTGTGHYWQLGGRGATNPFIGKMGCVKVVVYTKNTMNESDPFTYDGFKDQSAIVSLQNHGHLITGENVTGDSDDTIANNYDVPVSSTGEESALVDSPTLLLNYKEDSITNKGTNCLVKKEGARKSNRDQSKVKGLWFEWNK